MESRYLNRFRKIGEANAEQIKNRDSAGNLTEIITHAKGSLGAQHANIRELFSTSVEMVTGIDTRQQMMGVELVKNMPAPSSDISASPSKQLGYIQLATRFLQAGLLHFMEETYNAQLRIESLEKTIAQLAQYDEEMDLIGKMVPLDLDALEQAATTKPKIDSVTSSPVSSRQAESPARDKQTEKKKLTVPAKK